MTFDKRCEVGPVAELKTNSPEKDESEQTEFENREGADEACPQPDATNVDECNENDRHDGEDFDLCWREFEDVGSVGCESGGERGSQTRIHHEERHPAVHESDRWTISFTQENITTTGFRISRR